MCNELTRKGIDTLLLNFKPDNHYAFATGNIQREVVSARYVPSITKKPLREISGYAALVSRYRPDIIHTHLFEAEMVTRQVIVPGIKYVTHVHSHLENFRNFSWRALFSKQELIRFYEKKLLLKQYRTCNNNFIAITDETANYLRTVLPADLHRIATLQNAIDYNRFFKPQKNELQLPLRLITIGRLDENKNQVFLVHVVRRLHDKGIPATLDILGDGEQRKKIEQQAASLGISEFIRLQGSVDAVEQYLQKSHIYVHAARSEAFGLVCIEAMAAGLPCIMLKTSEENSVVQDGETGLLIQAEKPELFAAGIMKLARDEALYAKMSDNAKAYSRQFHIEPYVSRLLQFYERCATA